MPGSFQAAGGCPRLVASPLPPPGRAPHSRWSTVGAASLKDQRLLLVRASRAEPSQLTRPPPCPALGCEGEHGAAGISRLGSGLGLKRSHVLPRAENIHVAPSGVGKQEEGRGEKKERGKG